MQTEFKYSNSANTADVFEVQNHRNREVSSTDDEEMKTPTSWFYPQSIAAFTFTIYVTVK